MFLPPQKSRIFEWNVTQNGYIVVGLLYLEECGWVTNIIGSYITMTS